MPLFGNRRASEEVVHEPVPVEEKRHHGLFGSKRDSAPAPAPPPQVVEEPRKKTGLFGSRHERSPTLPPPAPVEEPPKKSGLFGSRHERSPTMPAEAAPVVAEEPTRRHGLFGSRRERSPSPASSRTSSSASSHHTGRKSGSLLQRSFGHGNGVELDPSIVEARERVMHAEAAEQEADRALLAARSRVREAHDHVKRLEVEAKEEARRAKIKQYHAREVSKRGKQLGRHGI